MGAADAADDSVRLSRLAPGVARVPISQGEPASENPRYELIATSLDKRTMAAMIPVDAVRLLGAIWVPHWKHEPNAGTMRTKPGRGLKALERWGLQF